MARKYSKAGPKRGRSRPKKAAKKAPRSKRAAGPTRAEVKKFMKLKYGDSSDGHGEE